MTEKQKVSNRFFARAVPSMNGSWYAAEFAAPGLNPRTISSNGQPCRYVTENVAERAAMIELLDVMNTRAHNLNRSRNIRYIPLTASELAEAFSIAGIKPTRWSFLTGQKPSTVESQLSGPSDGNYNRVPHWARVMLALFIKDPTNIELAESISEDTSSDRRDKKMG